MKFHHQMAALAVAALCSYQPAFAADRAAGAAPPAAPGAAAAAPMAQQDMDRKFVKAAAMGNMAEVKLAELALQRATDAGIKQLAQTIQQDHTQANQQLQQIAQAKGFDFPKELDPMHQAMLQHFEEKQGKEFERAYVICQVGDHVKDVLKYRDASAELQDPQLKQYATSTLPHIQHHLKVAEGLAGWSSAEAQPASATERGHGGATPGAAGDAPAPTAGSNGATNGGPAGNSTPAGAGSTGGSTPAGGTSGGNR